MTDLAKKIFYSTTAFALMAIMPDILSVSSASAQTASQVTRDSYAPPVISKAEGGGLSLTAPSGLDAPEGAEDLEVRPSGLLVEGALPDMVDATEAVDAQIRDKLVTGADLFAAARQLEAAYANAGYILARVSLPPQTIKDGMPLKLVVTDGYVESIDTSALPEGVRGRVEAMLSVLVGERGINLSRLERRLLLAGDTPGVVLRSTLRAGQAPGSTIIVVEGRYDPAAFTAAYQNSMAAGLGSSALTFGADANNLLGLGEVGYLRLVGHTDGFFTDDPRNRQVVLGATIPLGRTGAWFNIEGIDSETHPTSDVNFSLSGHYQRAAVQLGYHWLRSRNSNLSTLLSFDLADEKQTLAFAGIQTAFSEDNLRVVRLGGVGDLYDPWGGQLAGSLTASFGVDALGARQATAAKPMSRAGAQPDFEKAEASLRYVNTLADNRLQFLFSTRGQLSFGEPLPASEQLSLGGLDQLSSFNLGEIQADTGVVSRAELSAPNIFSPFGRDASIGGVVSPYVFGAAGVAKFEQPTAVERETTEAASFGAGFRLGLSRRASRDSATLSLEYARDAGNDYNLGDSVRVQLMTRF
ncbi:polypeptide-transport-associated domain-containing protein [Hyphomonas adhaerens MHS-3]|uniref:Polypeptide-transport-associated domain-containing protein n=1 Tax=Hyphomonas adhaerens MHS-3 TaxID=1280949 RepID=A0A069E803_9PROT|nr:ShlB/FhaC/HecB family hemolysin secretion/activation protein [Hyphomonas adhaerens]KCZ86109.1 polypeptide-transport-associated domain-containing protein [Hyphomonas adhaerens MHS-3]